MPELHQPRLPAQLQHLHEKIAQRLQMPPAELRDRAERLIPVTAMKSTRSSQARSSRRDEYTPRLYP
jgi:hypothetical protein